MSWWLLAAVAASIVSTMVLGMLWYGPIFGKMWMQAVGWGDLTEEMIQEKQKDAMPGYLVSMGSAAASTTLMWMVLIEWDVISNLGALPTGAAGALFGFVGWAMFYLPGTVTSKFFEGPNWTTVLLGAGYWGILAVLWGLYVGLFSTL